MWQSWNLDTDSKFLKLWFNFSNLFLNSTVTVVINVNQMQLRTSFLLFYIPLYCHIVLSLFLYVS